MKHFSKNNHILFPALAFFTLLAFLPGLAEADFEVASTSEIEVKPAVAHNSQTGKFLVAYLEEVEDLTYGLHYELRCQLHNADGSKNGGVLYPIGSGTHEALGRPAIDYNPNTDRFFVVIPAREEGKSGEFVMGRFLNGTGASLPGPYWGPVWLFNDGVSTYHEADISEDVNSLRVVCNTLLNEFMVTVQRTVPDIYPPPWDHRNVISAQRISYSSGLIGSVVQLADYGVGGIDGHAIAYADISGTTPAGGRYLFANAGFVGGVQLLDIGGNSITGVPLDLGEPAGGNTHPDIAYGEVDGKKRFLMVYSDEDNCRPGFDPCAGDPFKQWTGVWGAYVDPLVTSYGTSGNNTPFPISFIWSHLANRLTYTPRVSHNPNNKAFCVAWREVPFYHANNDESRSHIRGNTIDYFVEDGLYGSSVPLPASDSNVVISDVNGTCASGVPCYSNEDPMFPDVSASYGSSAVVVWHQTKSSTNLDVWGDFFSDFDYPETGRIDFDGDGKADILWRNTITGQVYIWLMNGTSIKSHGSAGSATSDWVIKEMGDCDGDGMADILWRNTITGQVYIWLMNGTSIKSAGSAGGATSDWVIKEMGDCDGDGMADILWRNSNTGQTYIWCLNGTSIKSAGSAGGATSDWVIQEMGDCDGDGMADILWRNSSTGQTYIWCLNGTSIKSQGSPGGATSDWVIQEMGDCDGDGKADIHWRNSSTGQVYIWCLNGTSIKSAGSAGSATSDWVIQEVGDYDGDGKTDILWRNSGTGQTYIWLMNGTSVKSAGSAGGATSDWVIISS